VDGRDLGLAGLDLHLANDNAKLDPEEGMAWMMSDEGKARPMHAFDVLADPVRRRILELLREGEHASGEVVDVVGAEFDISQSAVSQHLKVLRDSGFASVTVDGAKRIYAIETEPLAEVNAWLDQFRQFWGPRLGALATEGARGKRRRKKR
jgi:DNA-binding transcriptional ArsR family regulator